MKILDGNKACSNIAYLFSEVVPIYPITPSSPMAENIDYLTNTDKKNIFNDRPTVIEMESELGAAGALHGALLSGSLATTFTASQGLLLMIPNLYKIAGECLPGVIHVASRSIATHALSIFGDHQDIYAVRQTGCCILSSSNVNDAQNLAAVAHLSAIKGSLPFIHFFDGFRTSHELNVVENIKEEEIINLVDKNSLENFKKRALNINNKNVYGTSQTEDIYFQIAESRNKLYDSMPDIVNEYMEKINKIMNTDYKPFNYYGSLNAKNIIVAMGSVCDTIKLVIDNEIKNGNDTYGLIEVHLYRPFSKKYLEMVLPKNIQKIAVLDRTKEPGSVGEPLYLDIISSIRNTNIEIVGGRYGLSSKNVTPADIKSIYEMLDSKPVNNFTVGIIDDVTYLSLPTIDYHIDLNMHEIKIYGFGSDGMVSASKDMLSIVHDNLNYFVQGYFEYDSKKSGGVTISHLRLSNRKINAPFYVENPSLIVITKDEYFKKIDMLENVKDNAYILINTIKNEEELNEFLPNSVKETMINKHLNVNIINGEKIAFENNLNGKISKIIEVNILNILNVKSAEELIIKSIKDAFTTKGEDVVNNNINAVNESVSSIKKVNIILNKEINKENKEKNIFDLINERKGNNLKVSDVLSITNGAFPCALTKFEKRNTSILTPSWDKQKCIECGMCNIVCPHGVIRSFAVEDKNIGKPLTGNTNYNYYIGISNEDCTGCSLCVNICPTHALEMKENVKPTNELFDNYINPILFSKSVVKGLAFEKPLFEFSGACAGCGETPYIKLLTQIVGEKLVIANATGCSSIYGASAPSIPYLVPWANSLFEDNAEFAYGIYMSYKQKRNRIRNIIVRCLETLDDKEKELCLNYLLNFEDYKITSNFAKELDNLKLPKELNDLKDYIPSRSVWAIGGDGWAYDIGYNGIDHILHSNENINILVLDTEVYSNTGGQSSKSTRVGAVAEFADFGKKTAKKDLFKIACTIPNVYVASICLGGNMNQAIRAITEAEKHKGPSIVICYCPCIEHGIKNGMCNSIKEEKLAVECGYVILMRYLESTLYIDSPEPIFEKYSDFLNNEVRYNALKLKNEKLAKKLLEDQKQNAINRYDYYKTMNRY
ncbi:MAG: pyruvate:ferredoxin (flavodoxin) oxidoreductase [bacterium]|nr:pyruvate:ferredoxin (flavodoxin) oxidoreductase [bacterium]